MTIPVHSWSEVTGPGLMICLGVALGAYACVGGPTPTYPQIRELICAAAPSLPPGLERDRLLQLCAAEATVLQCAEAYEGAAAPLARTPTAGQTAP